jgi:hypothetical protein
MRFTNLRLLLSSLACSLSATCVAQSVPCLTLTQNANHEVVARVSGFVPSCNLTASGGEPTFSVQGNVVTVTQGVAGYMCTNPPAPDKLYERNVNFGRLADGTYTINWTFPVLTGTITVTGNPVQSP